MHTANWTTSQASELILMTTRKHIRSQLGVGSPSVSARPCILWSERIKALKLLARVRHVNGASIHTSIS